jgi:hypothetical protein
MARVGATDSILHLLPTMHASMTGFIKRGHLEQNKKIDICYHSKADNEWNTIEFESSQHLI